MCFDNLLYDFKYVQTNPILAVGYVDRSTIYLYFDYYLGLFDDPTDEKIEEPFNFEHFPEPNRWKSAWLKLDHHVRKYR